jgi:hypothetical protein
MIRAILSAEPLPVPNRSGSLRDHALKIADGLIPSRGVSVSDPRELPNR